MERISSLEFWFPLMITLKETISPKVNIDQIDVKKLLKKNNCATELIYLIVTEKITRIV